MPATVLGKRSRQTADAAESATIQTRSKRRITINASNDENQNPFVSRGDAADDDIDELALNEQRAKKTRRTTRTVPAKHGALNTRIEVDVLPSNSDDAAGKKPKTTVAVYQDSNTKESRTCAPQTPRHRDASKKIAVTPRHRVLVGSQLTPRSGKSPSTPSNASTAVYNVARQLFARCSNPGKLIGRDSEQAELSNFIQTRMSSTSGGCLYISGPPGTGKSALLDQMVQEQTGNAGVKISVVNCMSVRHAKDLSQKLAADLDLQDDAGFEYLRSCFTRGRACSDQKYLVILDEVDRLIDFDISLLYSLFEWSMEASSRLILIGIANALDLTDRLLPRLKSRKLKPELLPFMPYTASQIAEVLTAKLKSLTSSDAQIIPFLQPAAVQFCAKKVAAQTGDLRKAFDICRRAIDIVAQENRAKDDEIQKLDLQDSPSKTPLMENCNLASPSSPKKPRPVYTIDTAPKATIAHIARVTAQAFSNGTTQRLSALNLQQKAVLCALAAHEKRKRETEMQKTIFATPSKNSNSSAPTIKRLFETYTSLCTRENLLHPLSALEFRDVVEGLESLSLLSAADGKNGSLSHRLPLTPSRTPSRKGGFVGATAVGDEKRVASAVGVAELEKVLEGPGAGLLREMLMGDGI